MNNDKTKISKNRSKKSLIVAEIAEKTSKAKAMIFTNYQGLTHLQLEKFKREIKKADAHFAITKNTLLKLALKDKNNESLISNQQLDGQTGTIFLNGDIVAPLKALAKMIKELQKPEIKFGIMDGNILSSKDVKKLATLPSREQLIAQVVGLMKSPLFGLHRALNWNIQKFVLTLNAVAKSKPQG